MRAIHLPLLCAGLGASTLASAQASVPGVLGYQGRLLKADGAPEAGVVAMDFRVYDVASGGTALGCDAQQVALADGFYALLVGAGAACAGGSAPRVTPAIFTGVDLWLELVVAGQSLSPRQRIGSVAYALRAGDADKLDGLDSSAFAPATIDPKIDALTNRGVRSVNCDDYALKGWASRSDCLQDGRWHEAYRHLGGTVQYGTVAELKAHVHAGADVKVTVDNEVTSWPIAIRCAVVSLSDGNGNEVHCGGKRKDDGATIGTGAGNNLEWIVYGSTGAVQYTPHAMGSTWTAGGVGAPAWTFRWFVRY